MKVLKVLLFSAVLVLGVLGVLVFSTKPALADQCIGGWVVGDGYCGGHNVCHFGNCPCGCGTGCRDGWDNHWCWYDSGENKCWSNLFYSCAGFDYATCVGQGGCQWCVSAQSCPTGCGYGGGYVPDGSCGQTYCAATASCGTCAAESGCSSSYPGYSYYYVPSPYPSCPYGPPWPNWPGDYTWNPSSCCPAAQSCPTACHSDTQYVSNGSCGSTTCSSNAPAAGTCPTACGQPASTVPDGNCGTTTCAATHLCNVTITASAGAGGTISPSGSVSVTNGGNQTFTITASSGYAISSVIVDGASVGTVGSYTFTNVTANHTITASFAATTGTVSGSVFKDDNSDGIKDAGETGVNGATVYLVSTSTNVNAGTDASGGFSFSLVDPALRYRLELNPAYTWTVTKWSLNGDASAYSYATGGAGFYTRKLSDDFPFTVAAGDTLTVNLGQWQQNTNGLTIQLYDDNDLNGIAGDSPLTGADTVGMKFDCSPVGGPCQPDLTVTAASGQVLLPGLVTGVTYTITYKPPAASYQLVTDIIVAPAADAEYDCLGGASIPKPTSCNFTFTKDTVLKVGVSNQTLPWMQVLNGDVYSNYNANTSVPAIRINVHSVASPPTYRPVFIQGNAGGGGGGLILTRENSGNADCNGQKCSERDWVINGYAGGIPWHGAFDSISLSGGNVVYISGDYTLDASEKSKFQNGGTYFRKVVVVSGDFTINTNGVATGSSDPITAFIVSRKKIIVAGPTHAQELVIYGGLYAKEGFDFGTSLNSNEKPAIVIVYDPSLLLGY